MVKYIIEIPEDRIGDFVGSTHLLMPYTMAGHKGHHDTGLSLTPYTEPDRNDIEDEVWEFATICTKMNGADSVDVIGGFSLDIFTNYSYQEAKAKYEEWKKQNDEVRVGDELKDDENVRAVVLDIIVDDYVNYEVFTENGITDEWQKGIVVKTGRHFPEVAELLKKMREYTDD